MRYFFADCILDMQCYRLQRGGKSIRLRPKVFQVLTYLLKHRHRVVPKQELCEQVWDAQAVSDATIENCLKAIRRAIGDTGQAQRLIETRYGQGYHFVAPVMLSSDDMPSRENAVSPFQPALLDTAFTSAPLAPSPMTPLPYDRAPSLVDAGPGGEWKIVTVLSCTLVPPQVSGELGGLAMRQRQRHLLQESAHTVARQYGGMCRALGDDGVLLVFGAPVAQEDHASRAVYAALHMQQQLAGEQSKDGTCRAEAWEIRWALHTGYVAVETRQALHESNAVVVGDTVTQALALQEHALPGTLLCSATTARLIQRLVHLQKLPSLRMEGQDNLGTISQVLRRRTRAGLVASSATYARQPLVGRERELAMLHNIWGRVVHGQGQVVSIVGEAGMGKSRLVTAFRRSLHGQPHIYVRAACLAHAQTIPYQPVHTLLRRVCGIATGDPPDVMAAKVHRRLYEVGMDPTAAAPFLLYLLDHTSASPQPAANSFHEDYLSTFATLVQYGFYSSQRYPLVIEVEDLHWIDTASEAWLAGFAGRVAGMRLLLLVTFRPGYQQPWMGQSSTTQLALARLIPQDSAQVVHALFPTPGPSPALQREIMTQANGNPFFLDELTRNVMAPGTPQAPLELPEALYATLTARIDRLAPVAKSVLQTTAILGSEVSYTLLATATALPSSVLTEALAQLQRAAILYESTLLPETVYVFQDGLLRDTAYHALLEHTRRQHHCRIAQRLTEQFADTASPPLAHIAHHYTEAGCPEPAIAYWQEAGQQAARGASHTEAMTYFTRALALLGTLPITPTRARQELALQCQLGVQLATRGAATHEVEHAYARALTLCHQVGNAQELFPVLYGLSRLYKKRGKLQRARDLGEQLLLLAQQNDEAGRYLRAHYVLGESLLWLGEFSTARTHLEHGMAAYDRHQQVSSNLLHEADPWLGCLSALAVTLWFLGYPEQALQRNAEALALAYELAHPYIVARALAHATYLAWFLRDWHMLQERAEELRALAASHGFTELHARATYRYGLALVKQGQHTDGLAQFYESIQALERLQQAQHCFQHALSVARRQGAKMPELRATLSLSRLWQRQGKPTEAQALLAPVYHWFTEGLATADLQEARTLLGEVPPKVVP
jgi:DNA-binding winged helix-turn-helix (wHTH) protein/class 3 adenylate cyclase/tetratricopeptide (TPR) repeat protein